MQRLKLSGDRTTKKARTRRARGEILSWSERLAMQYGLKISRQCEFGETILS
jgi:hypothetical protein